MVEVKGTTFLADGALVATRVHREDRDFDGRSGDESEVEGFVTRFSSATDFDVDGQKVATNASTAFVNGTAADLELNVKVEVEGKLDATDTLVAAKVVFKRQSSLRLAAHGRQRRRRGWHVPRAGHHGRGVEHDDARKTTRATITSSTSTTCASATGWKSAAMPTRRAPAS